MFLTKKALTKIRLMTGVYCILGVLFLIISGILVSFLVKSIFLVILGIVCFPLAAVCYASGKYTEGKGKLINSGNKLVFQQLRPAEFIRLYEEKRDHPDNVIARPDFEVLQLLATAYDALGDTDRELKILEQLISIASEKKKGLAKLMKSAVLFSVGKVEEADLLYSEVLSGKTDLLTKATLDTITKSDRAMALGDYTIAETYYRQLLTQTFPKNTPLSILYAQFNLAKIYYATGRYDDAKIQLQHCIETGGETGIKSESANMLTKL